MESGVHGGDIIHSQLRLELIARTISPSPLSFPLLFPFRYSAEHPQQPFTNGAETLKPVLDSGRKFATCM